MSCWTDAVIEAKKRMAVTHYRGEDGRWRPLVVRYGTLPGDWVLDGAFLVGTAGSNSAGLRFQLGRDER